MKKLILLTLTLITSIILSSCGNSDNPISSTDNSQLINTKWSYTQFDTTEMYEQTYITKLEAIYSFTTNKVFFQILTTMNTDTIDNEKSSSYYKNINLDNKKVLVAKDNINAKGGECTEYTINNNTLTLINTFDNELHEKVNDYYVYQDMDSTGNIKKEERTKFITQDSIINITIKDSYQDTSYIKLDSEVLANLIKTDQYLILKKYKLDKNDSVILNRVQ